MNIFYIDKDPNLAAKYHYDRHVIKMILESAQLLSTCHHVIGSCNGRIYKPTHVNHPCSLWVRASIHNYNWLYQLYMALCAEYTFRFGKVHKTQMLANDLSNPPRCIPTTEFTEPYQAMPTEYKHTSSLIAYRKYYINGKKHLLKYTKRDIPTWLTSTND